MNLTLAAILAAQDIKREPVTVPEWGGDVFVAEINVEQRDQCVAAYSELKDRPASEQAAAFRDRLVAFAVVGEDGKPIFGLEHLDDMRKKNADVIDRLAQAALKLNKLEPKAQETGAKP